MKCLALFYLTDVGDHIGHHDLIHGVSKETARGSIVPLAQILKPGYPPSSWTSFAADFSLQNQVQKIVLLGIPHDMPEVCQLPSFDTRNNL